MNTANDKDLQRLDKIATLLDNQFRIPGTSVRFGLDAIIGLIPYVGDVAGLIVSSYLFMLMIKRGAGPIIMLRMLGNTLLDAAVGSFPVLGDIFDFGFKANRRNVELLKRYYAEPTERPSAVWSLLLLGIVFLAILGAIIWGITKMLGTLWNMVPG